VCVHMCLVSRCVVLTVSVVSVRGLQDEIGQLIRMEAVEDGKLSVSAMAVAVLDWAQRFYVTLERDTFCDALRATAVPGL
jgi:hypothetical protein